MSRALPTLKLTVSRDNLLDSSPGWSAWLHYSPGHGISINDRNPQLSEHVGHSALASGDSSSQSNKKHGDDEVVVAL